MNNPALSPDEIKALEATVAKRKQVMVNPLIKKEEVSPEEYARRLDATLRQDRVLVEGNRKKRIQKSISDWKNNKAGSLFANATTNEPKILSRVKKLTNGDSHNTSLLLHGKMGVGKTWTAYAYINMLIQSGVVTPGQIMAGTEASTIARIGTSGFKRNDMLEEILDPKYKVFLIDDFGQQAYYFNDTSRISLWSQIIDHIYTKDLTLILTTNLNVSTNQGSWNSPQIAKWVGDDAYDRIRALVGDGDIIAGEKNRRPDVLRSRTSSS